MNDDFEDTRRSLVLLAAGGLEVDVARVLDAARLYRSLCSTWNLAAKLMSARDLDTRFDKHFADSLSLGLLIGDAVRLGASYIDIGSGGGFPAIPLAIVLHGIPATLIERSATKADFLRHATDRLKLRRLRILQASYPCPSLPENPRVYTARATEQPQAVDKSIMKHLHREDFYLAQRSVDLSSSAQGFHAELVEDEFTRAGLRRGILYRISC